MMVMMPQSFVVIRRPSFCKCIQQHQQYNKTNNNKHRLYAFCNRASPLSKQTNERNMSGRALRKLRQEREAALAAQEEEDADDDSENESEGEALAPSKRPPVFAMMNGGSDSSAESSSDNENEEEKGGQHTTKLKNQESSTSKKTIVGEAEEEPEEEDFDHLLEEFKEQDSKKGSTAPSGEEERDVDEVEANTYFHILAQDLDIRDLDVDHVMRMSLVSAEPTSRPVPSLDTLQKNKRKRQIFLFGTPANLDLNVKPPHYVGGGIGMTSYDEQSDSKTRSIPWPYSDCSVLGLPAFLCDRRRWYTFLHSDSYDRDYRDFKRIQESGDMNALVLFVAHHPFVTEALMYLGLMLYQVNQTQEGLAFLRRCVWVYESAALTSFITRSIGGKCFIDYDQPENKTYFDVLFRLGRVNNMAGLSQASLAISRFIMSLDPLRDPTGTLLVVDHYALATNLGTNEQWLVHLVESEKIRIFYRDEALGTDYKCHLIDLPNWAYSYALALYRLNDSRPNNKANAALRNAIRRFPSIVDLLLSENDIDINSRSCLLDWQSVMDYTGTRSNAIHECTATTEMDPLVRMATDKAYDLISRIFAKLNHKHWAGDTTLIWVHSTLEEMKKLDSMDGHFNSVETEPLRPAIMRYSQIDPANYDTKFQLLPIDMNPLDLGLVQHALVIDRNRRRFLQNQRGVQRDDGGEDNLFRMFGHDGVELQNRLENMLADPEMGNQDLFQNMPPEAIGEAVQEILNNLIEENR